MSFDAPDCCEPGDITISEIPDGFLIGRSLPKLGLGPWWEYIDIVQTRAEALRRAQTESRERGRVWMQSTMGFERVPDHELETVQVAK